MELLKNLGRRLINGYHISFVIFLCPYCQKEVVRQLSNGKSAKSCGCIPKNYKHGEINTKLYGVWRGMKQRVLNPKCKDYKDYGGRDISICHAWQDDYIAFKTWSLNNGYTEGLTIDRKDNNGNYEPSNCQFVTSTENNRNQSTTKLTINLANEIRDLYKTTNYTQQHLADVYEVSRVNISYIINNKIWKIYE